MTDLETLDAALRALPPIPTDIGRVERVVLRGPHGSRTTPPSIRVEPGGGAIGDRWAAGGDPEAPITMMRFDVASLLCGDRDPALLGDNLFVHLDTSAANLPPGTELMVGAVRCVVTPKPHRGCSKFAARVGHHALKLTASAAWKAAQLRGVHLAPGEAGEIAVGDPIRVLSRPAP